MSTLVDAAIFIVGIAVLVKAGDAIVKSISNVGSYLKLSEFVLGFAVLAISTTLPEFFVGVSSALRKEPSIILGTVIGSIIANLTLVIGIATLLGKGLHVKIKTAKRDALYMFMIASMPIILMVDKKLSQADGVILLAVFLLYMLKVLQQRKEFHKKIGHVSQQEFAKSLAVFLACVILLFLSSSIVVNYASKLSEWLVLPPMFIGLFIVAAGTSLPDLTLAVRGALAKEEELVVGDILGAAVTNSTLVLGVSALLFPITAPFALFFTSAAFMLVVAFLFMMFVESGKGISLREGVTMLLLYSLFVFIEFYVKTLNGGS